VQETNDNIIARLAVESGAISVTDLRAARDAQQAARKEDKAAPGLSELLLERKLLDREQVRAFENLIALQSGEERRLGNYELIERMGTGSLSSVYHAVTCDTGRDVAVKILQPALATPELAKRFEREAKAAQRLDHPHIVSYLDIGYDKERAIHYCACGFLPGSDLAKIARREKQMDQMRAARIARDVASALAHAADNGLIHRDVKPENIMVAEDGAATLLHLGLASPVTEQPIDEVPSGAVVTSAFYAPPEGPRDTRSDIYSLGATLYYLVTGRQPFRDLNVHSALAAHKAEHIPWPGDVNTTLNDRLCLVIAKMMARDPDRRYRTAHEVVADLEAVIEYRDVSVDETALDGSTVAAAGAMPVDGTASTDQRKKIAAADTHMSEPLKRNRARPAGVMPRPRPAAQRADTMRIITIAAILGLVALAGALILFGGL
jgi:serine/threonine protein kinase